MSLSERPEGRFREPDVSALLAEALDKVAAPAARDEVLSRALHLAGFDSLPVDIHALMSFVAGPLHEAIDGALGPDAAHALVSDVRPLLERAFRIRTSMPPPSHGPPESRRPISTLPPTGLFRASPPHAQEPIRENLRRRSTLPYADATGSRGFVLIVDDDLAFLRGFGRLLRLAGYDAVAAPDGHAALRLCRRLEPALVISDLQMPPPNGMELAALIADMMGEGAPPVLLLTGSPELPVDVPGVSAVLSKSIHPNELLAEIEPYLVRA